MARITERQLILPSLYLIYNSPRKKLNTTQLKLQLVELLKPDGEDAEILAGRKDSKFTQKVRNLKSHDSIRALEFTKYQEGVRNSPIEITKKGIEYLSDNIQNLENIVNGFDYEGIKLGLEKIYKATNQDNRKVTTLDENTLINEGSRKVTQTVYFERSKKLRDFAVDYFTVNGKINCECCTFNFEDFYGQKDGNRFIEIHHKSPVFKYEDEDMETTLANAVLNLSPLCSNCHRMIHRNWKKPLEVDYLRSKVQEFGVFKPIARICNPRR